MSERRQSWEKRNESRTLTGRPWRRLRDRIMARDGWLCQACAKNGKVTLAKECDHIVPQSKGGTDADSNLQALCIDCHAEKTKAESNEGYTPKQEIGLDGWPIEA